MAQFLRQRQLYRKRDRIAVPCRYLEGFQCREHDEIITSNGHNISLSDTPPLTCRFSKWIRDGAFMATADEAGVLSLYDIRRPLCKALEGSWEAHSNAVFDLAWMPVDGEAKLLTASGDQKIHLWDCARTNSPLATFAGHSGSVKSVSFCQEEPMVFASGARDGHIMLWDLRVNRSAGDQPYQVKPCSQLFNAHSSLGMAASSTSARPSLKRSNRSQAETAGRQSVTAVLFRDDRCIVSAGGGDGMIKVWDIRMPRSIHQLVPTPTAAFSYCGGRQGKHGFTGLVMDPIKATVFASCTDDVVYRYDIAACSPKPVSTIQSQGLGSYYVKMDLSADGQFLVTGSMESDALIYQVNHPQVPHAALSGHVGEVMAVAFCPGNQEQLVTCSDDCSVRLWRHKNTAALLSRDLSDARLIGRATLVAAPPEPVVAPTACDGTVAAAAGSASREPGQVTPSRDKCMRTASMLSFVKVTPSRTALFQDDKENIAVDSSAATSAAAAAPARTGAEGAPTHRAAVVAGASVGPPPAKRMFTLPLSPSRQTVVTSSAGTGTTTQQPTTPKTPLSPATRTAVSPSTRTALTPVFSASSRSRTSPGGSNRAGRSSSNKAPGTPKLTSLQQWLSPRPQPPSSSSSPAVATGLTSPSGRVTPTRSSQQQRLSPSPSSSSPMGGMVCAAGVATSPSTAPTTSCRQNLLSPMAFTAVPSPESPALSSSAPRMATAE
ncbi:denticleless protein homolog [Sycon ciliatum]|uniref:denticleless protein homolog n=1 Tax=Sycon ciliatum TaxID=27933 RepID=UPI0031F662C2